MKKNNEQIADHLDFDVMEFLKDIGLDTFGFTSQPKHRKFWKKTKIIINAILNILNEIEGAVSTRQMYYQLISKGLVQPNKSGYNKVQRLLVTLRRDGIIRFDRIIDRTRSKHQRPSWNGMQDILETCSIQYRRDYWVDQNTAIYIAVEKQALEGVFAEVCDDYGVSLFVLRGSPSVSLLYDWAEEIKEFNREGKEVKICYFGDFDASGMQIDETVVSNLIEFGADFTFERTGVLPEDIEKFNLMTLPVKRTDTRAKKFIERYGVKCVELDALPPNELKQRIKACIHDCINTEKWNRIHTIHLQEQITLDKFIHTLN